MRGGMLHIVSAQTPLVSSCIYRALTGNGRHCTVQTIERMYEQVVDMWHKHLGEDKDMSQLRIYIVESLRGFQHLIDVYSSDSTTVSRMEVVVQHVKSTIGVGLADATSRSARLDAMGGLRRRAEYTGQGEARGASIASSHQRTNSGELVLCSR